MLVANEWSQGVCDTIWMDESDCRIKYMNPATMRTLEQGNLAPQFTSLQQGLEWNISLLLYYWADFSMPLSRSWFIANPFCGSHRRQSMLLHEFRSLDRDARYCSSVEGMDTTA
jgi:hypothetical protein